MHLLFICIIMFPWQCRLIDTLLRRGDGLNMARLLYVLLLIYGLLLIA